MNVLVIPEDFRNDQYILKPIVDAMLASVGRPHAKVKVCREPVLGGIGQALQWRTIEEIIDLNPTIQLFLLCIDRDGVAGRRAALDIIEQRASAMLGTDRTLLTVNAWQEIEVWVLAGHGLPAGWPWRAIRAEPNAKERYFQPFAERRGVTDRLGAGRQPLAIEAARNYNRVRRLCPEVRELEDRIRRWLEGGA